MDMCNSTELAGYITMNIYNVLCYFGIIYVYCCNAFTFTGQVVIDGLVAEIYRLWVLQKESVLIGNEL